jgi:predicted enzyme related to lactoylglutathione lyase
VEGEESAMAKDVKELGKIAWMDLTIPDAAKVRDFYVAVTGWGADEFKVGDHNDYVIKTPEKKETLGGICHAKGENAALPATWIIYIKVHNLDASLAAAKANGGEIVSGPKSFGASRFCVLRDPAGAVFAVIEEGEEKG